MGLFFIFFGLIIVVCGLYFTYVFNLYNSEEYIEKTRPIQKVIKVFFYDENNNLLFNKTFADEEPYYANYGVWIEGETAYSLIARYLTDSKNTGFCFLNDSAILHSSIEYIEFREM